MDKRIVPIIAITGALVLCLVLIDKSRSSRVALVKAKADAAEAKRIDAEDEQRRDALEAQQGAIIANQTLKISALLANIGKPTPEEIAKDEEIAALKRQMAESEAAGDIVGALVQAKQTIVALEFTLALVKDQHKADLFRLDMEWQGKFDALKVSYDARGISLAVKDNHIFKLENLCAEYAHTIKVNKFWAAVGKYGPPVAFVAGIILGK